MPDPISLSQHDAIATLTLDRRDAKNALTQAMWRAIPGFLQKIGDDPTAKILVVTGAAQCFAAGADIGELEPLSRDRAQALAYAADMAAAVDSLASFAKPTIAKIEGPCIGGGLAIAVACDLRFAAETARFGVTPARLGLVYSLADTKRLIASVGLSAAKDLLFSGRILPAMDAKQIGLVDFIVADGRLGQAVSDYADILCANSQFSIRATKRMLARLANGQMTESPDSLEEFATALAAQDFTEGHAAFQAKRPANFPWS